MHKTRALFVLNYVWQYAFCDLLCNLMRFVLDHVKYKYYYVISYLLLVYIQSIYL